MMKISALLFLSCILLAGCQPSYQVRTYDVTLQNNADAPVTIWLTKDGPPFEPGWLSPEDIAVESPKASSRVISGVVVPQGKVANTGEVKGQFDANTHAVLRIYAGQLKFEEILAHSRGAANRFDLKLEPGKSSFVVTGNSGAIQVKQAENSQ